MSDNNWRNRMRWRIITQLNRLSGQCWADLVSWAVRDRKGGKRSPWSPAGETCRLDAAENGGRCYCSKIQGTA